MKIAFVVGSFPELSSTFILDQVTGLLDRGHDVHVFARKPGGTEPVHAAVHRYGLTERTHYWGGTPHARRAASARTVRLFLRDPRGCLSVMRRAFDFVHHGYHAASGRYWAYASTMLLEGRFDVVFAPFGTNGRLSDELRAIGAFDAPIATSWLGYDLTRIIRDRGGRYYARLFERGDLMLPLSEYFRSLLLDLGCPPAKIRVLHLGVDPGGFEFSPRALGAGETVRIITVCRLVEKKGLGFALQALARARATGARFEYHLVGDGPLREELERQVRELGLTREVIFHGPKPREQVRPLLARSHLFLSPSVTARDGDQEGTPVAILEAMASGLPVISTRHSGIPEVIEDGVSGYVVPEWDVPLLADRITHLVTHPEEWSRLSGEARRTIEARFDQRLLNDELSELLIELASRERRT